MSARFRKEDSRWIHTMTWQGYYGAMDEALILAAFDQDTDDEITLIQKLIDKEQFLRRVCKVKLVTYPIEFLSILIFLGREKAADHTKLTKIYYRFLSRKLTLEKFREKLQEFYKERPIA